MTDETRNRKLKKAIFVAAASLCIAAVGGFLYWTTACPCERTPGFVLFGEQSTEQITDWSFANQVPLCQIQIYAGWRPHSINLNCMATPEGDLYLSCSFCVRKYWASKVIGESPGKLRLNGTVYPITVTRVMDEDKLDQIWRARVKKLQTFGGPGNPAPPPDAPRAEGWWSFQVSSSI